MGPVFLDREYLPASSDLSEAVKEALAGSQALIVLCTPDAVRSEWVAREIELFRALHPDRPVLAALFRGHPDEAFPPEIRRGGVEPLAADFRRSGDGRKLAFLKVVAGVLQIPLDELIQREGQRRQRRVIFVTAAACALMLILATMTILAIDSRREAEQQRAEAERQRGEAEGLIEYMLTDLRPRLKAVGKLEIMSNVNRRALLYYKHQGGFEKLSDDSLELRARFVSAMGEDNENAGDHALAAARYEVLYRATAARLAKDPDNPDRILAHADSVNRVALLAITDGRFNDARPHLERLRELLRSIPPWGQQKPEWLRLSAFLNGNSCAMILKAEPGATPPLALCRDAVRHNEAWLKSTNGDGKAAYALVFHLLWLAQAQLAAGEQVAARRTQDRYLELLDEMRELEPDNMDWTQQRMEVYVRHAAFLQARGERSAARQFTQKARILSGELAAYDPRNAVWSRYKKRLGAVKEE